MYRITAGRWTHPLRAGVIGKRLFTNKAAMLAFLLAPAFLCAQQVTVTSIASAAGATTVDHVVDAPKTREADPGAETERLFWESELRRHEVTGQQSAERIRSRLAQLWEGVGFAAPDAQVLAAMYEPAESGAAAIVNTRLKGTQAAMLDIKAALHDQNLLLANQLLIALILVGNEEPSRAARVPGADPAAQSARVGTSSLNSIQ